MDHSAVAEKTWEGAKGLAAVLEDYRTAPIDERLRTTLAFLEKLTLTPGEVGPDDIAPMRAAGVSDQAVEEAIYVATVFNVMDRFADTFDFELPRPEDGPRTAWTLTKLGYGIGSVPG
jgi:alkylhydroperoxidase family enzyme